MSARYPDRIETARPRGRPRVEERLEFVGTSLPKAYVQRLEQIAEQRDMKVSALVRQLLIMRLPRP